MESNFSNMARTVTQIVKATPRREGPATVNRALPSEAIPFLDPFLAIGEFRMPAMKGGFGFHPHSGVEFITYQLDGQLTHSSPDGVSITLKAGDAIHLMAGEHMVHSETPVGEEESHGIQLWVDVPNLNKNDPHTYKKLDKENVPVDEENGVIIRTIVSNEGPLKLHTPAIYLDVLVTNSGNFIYNIPDRWNAFMLILSGNGEFGKEKTAGNQNDFLVFDKGSTLTATAKEQARFLVLAGQPLNESGKGMFG